MPAVQREGDFNIFGGIIVSGDNSVNVNGRAIALAGTPVTPHPPCSKKAWKHCVSFTKPGTQRTFVNGQSISLTFKADFCGCLRIGGSGDVNAI